MSHNKKVAVWIGMIALSLLAWFAIIWVALHAIA